MDLVELIRKNNLSSDMSDFINSIYYYHNTITLPVITTETIENKSYAIVSTDETYKLAAFTNKAAHNATVSMTNSIQERTETYE